MTYFLDLQRVVTGRALDVSGQKLVIETNPLISEKFTMSRGSIESTSPSAVCLIPGGLVDALSQDEILDMIAYLVSLSGQDFPGE